MKIIGLDPGLNRTGWGVIEETGQAIKCSDFGHIDTNPKAAFPDRLTKIYDDLERIIMRHQPDSAAIEQVFYAQNINSALKL